MGKLRPPWVVVVAGVAMGVLLACAASGAFYCGTDSQCGDGGTCQPDGYCSFLAPGCESGQVYGNASPDAVAGQCVPTSDSGRSMDATGSGSGAGASESTTSSGLAESGEGGTSGSTTGATSAALDSSSDSDSSGMSSEGTGAGDGRVTDGLLALYRFDLTQGLEVPDLSGVAPAMPMTVMQVDGSPVATSEGLVFDNGGIALVDGPADKVRNAIQASGALSAEVWSTAAQIVQEGPPRLFTLSKTPALRSFSILHGGGWDARGVNDGDEFGFRMYAEGSTSDNGSPTMVADAVITLSPMHWVATRTSAGFVELWADGVLTATYDIPGSLGVWADDDMLAVGNELTVDIPYRGTVHLAAVYDRALSEDEVGQNYAAGYLSR